jgi:hypothetical protein
VVFLIGAGSTCPVEIFIGVCILRVLLIVSSRWLIPEAFELIFEEVLCSLFALFVARVVFVEIV